MCYSCFRHNFKWFLGYEYLFFCSGGVFICFSRNDLSLFSEADGLLFQPQQKDPESPTRYQILMCYLSQR